MPSLRLNNKLRVLSFYAPVIESLHTVAEDLRLCLLEEELRAACPGLTQVSIVNDIHHAQLFGEISWFVAISDKRMGYWQLESPNGGSQDDEEGEEDGEGEEDEEDEGEVRQVYRVFPGHEGYEAYKIYDDYEGDDDADGEDEEE